MDTNRTTIDENEAKYEKQQKLEETILWTVEGTANQLMVSSKTVKRLIEEGELPIVPIRGCIRVPKQAVLDWVESQTRYNLGCVGSVQSSQGESTCDSINVTAFITLPTSQQVENRLGALLKPRANK